MIEDARHMLSIHTKNIEALGSEMLFSIARSEEPFNYNFVEQGIERQIEAIFTHSSDNELEMLVALDSDHEARFKPQSYTDKVYIKRMLSRQTNEGIEKILDLHVENFKRMGFDALLSISRSKEPITYTFMSGETEYQAEVIFKKE